MVVVTNTQSLVKVGSKICHKHAALNSNAQSLNFKGQQLKEWEEDAVK